MKGKLQIMTVAGLALVFGGCATTDTASGPPLPVNVIPREVSGPAIAADAATFAVMACDADEGATGPAGEFSRLLRTVQLIQALRSTMGERVYFAPQPTVAADYLVRITTESGKLPARKIAIEGTDGEPVRYRTARGAIVAADRLPLNYVRGTLGETLASRIAQATSQTPLSQTEVRMKRLAGYLEESGAVVMNEKMGRLVDLAAQLERDKLLKTYTDHLISFVESNRETYQNYVQEKARLDQAKAEEKRRENAATMLAFGNALLSGLAQGGGDTATAAQAQRNAYNMADQAVAASARVDELEQAVGKLTSAFAAAVQPTEISFLDEVVKLAGTHEEQMTAARALIKRKLREQLNTP